MTAPLPVYQPHPGILYWAARCFGTRFKLSCRHVPPLGLAGFPSMACTQGVPGLTMLTNELQVILRVADEVTPVLRDAVRAVQEAAARPQVVTPLRTVLAGVFGALCASPAKVSRRDFFRPWRRP